MKNDRVESLRAAVAQAEVITDPSRVAELSADSSPRSRKAMAAGRPLAIADVAVRVRDTADVAAVVRWAGEQGLAVIPRGGGSGVVGSGLPITGGVLLDLSGLDRVGEVDVPNRLVTVGAGVIGSALEKALAPFGLTSGHYPQSLDLASIGGWVAMRGSGTFSSLHGNIEDRLADLTVVLPDGTVTSTRSIPRASEGPDLKQLFVGSEGALGIVTGVTLRLVPLPAARRFAAFGFSSFEAALDSVRELLWAGVRPAVARIYDPVEARAKHTSFTEGEGWLTVLLFDGDERLVAAQEAIAADLAARHEGTDLGPEPAVHWEQRRFDWSWFTDAVHQTGGIAEAIEVAGTWTQLPALYADVRRAAQTVLPEVMAHVSHVYDQGASLYVISRGQFNDDESAIVAYDQLWRVVMEVAVQHGVRISHHHGIGRERGSWLGSSLGAESLALLRTVKAALDPHRRLTPGAWGQ